ncbi:MAG: sirohydrochlorin cobaltochelatase, partial [Candidatus Adiutrix sp.]
MLLNEVKPAIILAAFGSAEVEAIGAIVHIKEVVVKHFPTADISVAFTSGLIRKIWAKRGVDEAFKQAHPHLPLWLYHLLSPLAAIVLAAEKGPCPIYVQSLHINNGEEFQDLSAAVTQLKAIDYLKPEKSPFKMLKLGPSAFGAGTFNELDEAACAVSPLFEKANSQGYTLVLLGHGSSVVSTTSYEDFEATIRRRYGPNIYVGLLEGPNGYEHTIKRLKDSGQRRVLLAPLMLVAGGHAKNDLAGPTESSWFRRLRSEGFVVSTHLEGLGSLDS